MQGQRVQRSSSADSTTSEAGVACKEWNAALLKVLSGIDDLRSGQAHIQEHLKEIARAKELLKESLGNQQSSDKDKSRNRSPGAPGNRRGSLRADSMEPPSPRGGRLARRKSEVRRPDDAGNDRKAVRIATKVGTANSEGLDSPQLQPADSSLGCTSSPLTDNNQEGKGRQAYRSPKLSFTASEIEISEHMLDNASADRDEDEDSGNFYYSENGSEDREADHARERRLLPMGWPSTIEVRKEFIELKTIDVEEHEVVKAMSRTKNSMGGMKTRSSRVDDTVMLSDKDGAAGRGLDPNSWFVAGMDFCGFFVLVSDLVVNPLSVAWNLKISGALAVLTVMSAVFWLIDMALCFLTGFHRGGELITDRHMIAVRYLRTWWVFDALLCSVDWTNVLVQFLESTTGTALFRTMRMLKILKLIRAGRLVRLMEKAQTQMCNSSPMRRLLLKALQVVFGTLLSSHVLTCVWFAIGKEWTEDSGESWLTHPAYINNPGFTYGDAKMLDQYLTALHWTVAQLTMGSSEIYPANCLERAFTITLLMAGLLFGSSVVSLFSAQIVQVMMSTLEKATKLDQMRVYLKQASVSRSLSVQVMAQTVERLKEEDMVRTDDVIMLKHISTSLRFKLMYETCLPTLVVHPLFESWAAMNTECILQMCREAVTGDFISAHMEVFLPGNAARYAYYVKKGVLDYTQPQEYSMDNTEIRLEVKGEEDRDEKEKENPPPPWVCEAALWSDWVNLGALVAQKLCQVVKVDADNMWQVLREHPQVASTTAHYCRNFHVRICAAKPPHSNWPNDVSVPFTDPRTLLASHIGVGLLTRALHRNKLTMRADQVEKMMSELREEKCGLEPLPDGTFCRIVYVEAVRVESPHGLIFVQVGTWDQNSGSTLAKCQYPAKKRARAELPQAVLKKLFDQDLRQLDNHVHFVGQEEEEENAVSQKYGIRTTYHRTVHVARLQGPVDDLGLRKLSVDRDEMPPKRKLSTLGREPRAGTNNDLADFTPLEVYLLGDGSAKCMIYAWLDPDSFEILRNPNYEARLQVWLTEVFSQSVRTTEL